MKYHIPITDASGQPVIASVGTESLRQPRIAPITTVRTVVNGYAINTLANDPDFKFSVETKNVGLNGSGPTTIRFTTLKDARRWARLN